MIEKKDINIFSPEILHLFREQKKTNDWVELARDYENVQKILEPSERFLNERIQTIRELVDTLSDKEYDDSLVHDSVMCLHLIPIIDMISKPQLDMSDINSIADSIHLIDKDALGIRTNVNGYQVFNTTKNNENYTHIFRNYSIESFSNSFVFEPMNSTIEHKIKLFHPICITKNIKETIISHSKLLRELKVSPPILLKISFIGVNSVSMKHDSSFQLAPCLSYDSNELHLPTSIITDYKYENHISNILTEQLNHLWNAFGILKCYYLDENGSLTI